MFGYELKILFDSIMKGQVLLLHLVTIFLEGVYTNEMIPAFTQILYDLSNSWDSKMDILGEREAFLSSYHLLSPTPK